MGRLKWPCSTAWALAAGLSLAHAVAAESVVAIKLSEPDAYVTRRIEVTDSSGKILREVVYIERFEPDEGYFVMEDFRREQRRVPAQDIRKLTVIRQIQRQPMHAQTAQWTVMAFPGERREVTVPAAKLVIEGGKLLLKEAAIQAWAETNPAEKVEVTRITFDPSTTNFRIGLQKMRYQKDFLGGSGAGPGPGKGLQ